MSFDGIRAGSSIGSYLGISLREVTPPGGEPGGEQPPRIEGSLPVAAGACSPAGGLTAGALLTAADSVAGICAGLAALPRWVVSTNLHLRIVRPAHTGQLSLSSRVLRVGRDAVVTDACIRSESGEPVAVGFLTSSALAPAGGPPALRRPLVLRAPGEPGAARTHWSEFFAIGPGEGDVVARLELRDHLRNPWGILHGGGLAVLADAAAVAAVRARTGSDGITTGCALHFLAPARQGPVDARAHVLGERSDGHVVRIEIADRGAGRVVAVATAAVVPLAASG